MGQEDNQGTSKAKSSYVKDILKGNKQLCKIWMSSVAFSHRENKGDLDKDHFFGG